MSENIEHINVKVTGVKKLNNSVNGNPKYKFYTNKGVVTTPSDALWVYAFSTNTFINKMVDISYHLTKSGKAILNSIKEVENDKH
jgi:hypothetical protein